jgi:spermidine/putrescine-binding protein
MMTMCRLSHAAAIGLVAALWSAAAAADEIRVLNWKGYGTDEAWSVQLFQQRTGTLSSTTISIPTRRC